MNALKITLFSFPVIYTLCVFGSGLYDSYTHKIHGFEGLFYYAHILEIIFNTAFFFVLFVLGYFTIAYFFEKIYKKTDKKKEKIPYISEGLFWTITILHIIVFWG